MDRTRGGTVPRATRETDRWIMASLPLAAAVLVFLNGLYIALMAFGNITD